MSPDISDSDLQQIRLALDVRFLDRCSEVADTNCRAIDAHEATDAQFWLADDEPAQIRWTNRLGRRPANSSPGH